MTKKSERKDKEFLTIEELAEEAGISKGLIAKLVRDEVLFPVSARTTYYDDMNFHESALRVIKRWEEEIMGRVDFYL